MGSNSLSGPVRGAFLWNHHVNLMWGMSHLSLMEWRRESAMGGMRTTHVQTR